MVSSVNNQTIAFTANWDASNSSLQDTLSEKVSKVALNLLHRLSMIITLPATLAMNRIVQAMKNDFIQRDLTNRFLRKPIEVTTPDGAKLKGTFLQSPGANINAPVVIFANPNGGLHTGSAFSSVLTYARDTGKKCNFILFDYRGCGESQGTALLAKDLIVDGESMYQFARDQLNIDPKDIHMMGWSFGGGVTAKVKALHPECTGNYVNDRSFIGIIETVHEMFDKGIFSKIACALMRVLGWDALNAGNALENLQGRTLITYHKEDRVIKDTAQLAKSPNARRSNIAILELQGIPEEDIKDSHNHSLSMITQNNGRKAIEEVGDVLFSGIPSMPRGKDLEGINLLI